MWKELPDAFLHRCAQHEGWYEESVCLVDCLHDAQMAVVGKKAFWVQQVTELLRTKPELQGKEMTAKEWCEEKKKQIPYGERDTLQGLDSRKFALYCTKSGQQLMERFCGQRKVPGKGKNRDKYQFFAAGGGIVAGKPYKP